MKTPEQIQEAIEHKINMLRLPDIPNKDKELIQAEISQLRWVLKHSNIKKD